MAWSDKPLKKLGMDAVPQRFNPDTNEWEVETTDADKVTDETSHQKLDASLAELQNLKTELQAQKAQLQGIIDGTTPANTRSQLTGSTATLQTSVNNFPQTQDVNVLNQPDGLKLQEQLSETDAVSGALTFSDVVTAVDIYNQDTVEGVFTINNLAITVPADTFFTAEIGGTPSATVNVSGTTSYVIGRYA